MPSLCYNERNKGSEEKRRPKTTTITTENKKQTNKMTNQLKLKLHLGAQSSKLFPSKCTGGINPLFDGF